MPRLAATALCLVLAWTTPCLAQSSDQALQDFRTQILKKQLISRGFSADPVTTFKWNGTDLSSVDPRLHTLGVLMPDSVDLKGDKLKISGKRWTLVKDRDGTLKLAGEAKASMIVDLKGADPAQVLPTMQATLFFPTQQDAFAALPPEYASIVKAAPKPKDSVNSPPATKKKECPVEGQQFKHPSLLYAADAEFSEEARHAHYSGQVETALTVGEDGLPYDIWIIRPAGLGLDQKAAEAVSKYKFKPATCDGTPIKETLFIEVSFSILK